MTAAASPAVDHRPQGAPGGPAPRASWRGPRSASWTPPIRVAAVPISPVRTPGRLERRDREERGRRLAVRAGDPDDRQLVARVAVPPGCGAGEGRRVARRRRAAGGRRPGRRARRAAAAAPAAAAAATKSWPSTCEPGMATNSDPGRTARESWVTPRTAMSASPAAPIARPSRRAPRSRPSAVEPLDEAGRAAGLGRLGGREQLGDRARRSSADEPREPLGQRGRAA